MQTIGSESGAVLISIGDEVVVLCIRDARDLAAEINRIVRAPRPSRAGGTTP